MKKIIELIALFTKSLLKSLLRNFLNCYEKKPSKNSGNPGTRKKCANPSRVIRFVYPV